MSEKLNPERGGFSGDSREMNATRWPVSARTVLGQTEVILRSILEREADAWLHPELDTEAPITEERRTKEERRGRCEQFLQAARVTEGAIGRAMQTMEYQIATSSVEHGALPGREGVDLLRQIEELSKLEQKFSQEAAFYAPEDKS